MSKRVHFSRFFSKVLLLIGLASGPLVVGLPETGFAQASQTPGQPVSKPNAGAKPHTVTKPHTANKPAVPAHPFWAPSLQQAQDWTTQAKGVILVRWVFPGSPDSTKTSDKVLKSPILVDSLKRFAAAGVFVQANDSNAAHLHTDEEDGAFLFINDVGTVLYRFDGLSPTAKDYLTGMRQALGMKKAADDLKFLEWGRMMGNQNQDSLEAIISLRNRLDMPTDSLLDIYIYNLPVDSGKSLRVLKFLAQQAPVLNGYANELLRQNPTLFKLVWDGMPMTERIGINNRVIEKTWKKAIMDQDPELAKLAATYAGSTNRSPAAQVRAFQGIMMEYYFGMQDTAKFLDLAGTYYDRFLMPISADSLKTEDSLHQRLGALSVCRFVGSQLSKGAYRVSLLSSDPALLKQAGAWAQRAAELYNTPQTREVVALLQNKGKPTAGR
jgi:hypothetical protein